MKGILTKIFTLITIMTMGIVSLTTTVFAEELKNQKYTDFSSDRSTYFFRLEGGDNDKVFFDFFSPFDPTVKVDTYDPLAMYQLENNYYFNDNHILMINLEDLKKLYDPYFNYEIKNNILSIKHTVYDKVVTDGFGERATTIEYTKKVWDLKINLQDKNMNTGSYNYTEYMPTVGGRNKGEITDTEVNTNNSLSNISFTFKNSKVEEKDGQYYVPISELMELMGKISIEEEGYLAIQQKDLADVTKKAERSDDVSDVVIPSASNVWNPGTVENLDENYTWADYMNDVADGKRNTGWLWRAFYIPSGSNFKDGDGNIITIQADRIVPFNIYVPTNYNKDETRLTYMLHGGTGNENAPTYRIMQRNIEVDKIAEEYNYIIVAPNGWTQNPIWRENQALYSFEKSFEMVMEEFPVNEDKIFITGNSLGGRGTLELAMRFSDRFKAFVASAPKIADKSGSERIITIEDTKYDLSSISDMPAMIIQGTADSTTSFKTQIGSELSLGSISKAIMPKLNNATYITVEQGDHSYAYGSVLTTIFDFFESTITSKEENVVNTLNIEKNSKNAFINEAKYRLDNLTKVIDGTVMISLSDLKNIYGEDFNVYSINSYATTPTKSVDYYTVVYNNKSVNFTLGETTYRKNMERYKEDANIIKSGAASDEDELQLAPQLSVAPYEKSGEIFVPVEELLNSLELSVTISEKSGKNPLIINISLLIIASIGIMVAWKLKKN